eukprot:scaffold10229_cov116-Isochrysis_galbana.AAC.4
MPRGCDDWAALPTAKNRTGPARRREDPAATTPVVADEQPLHPSAAQLAPPPPPPSERQAPVAWAKTSQQPGRRYLDCCFRLLAQTPNWLPHRCPTRAPAAHTRTSKCRPRETNAAAGCKSTSPRWAGN